MANGSGNGTRIRTGSPQDFADFGGKIPKVELQGGLLGGKYQQPQTPANINRLGVIGDFKNGGVVKKTGNYKLHKGERVIPASASKTNTPKRKGHPVGDKRLSKTLERRVEEGRDKAKR